MSEVTAGAGRRAGPRRLGLALAVASLASAFALARSRIHPTWTTDLDQIWYAARALLHGSDPYAAVGPGRTFDWPWPLYYPLPAVLLGTPFALLPIWAARVAFSGLGGFIVGYAIAPRWSRYWPVLLSMAFFSAISRNQWSPFVLAAAWVPLAGAVIAIKPNVGLITFAAQARRGIAISLVTAGALFLASFVVRPSWLPTWLSAISDAPNKEVALLQPFGFFLAAAILSWRTVEGRVLLAMSLVPHTPSLYDLLPVFIIPYSARQALVVALLTHVAHWGVIAFGPYQDRDAAYDALARLEVAVVLLPVLGLVLAERWRVSGPGRGDVPLFSSLPPFQGRLLDGALIVLSALSIALQLWLVFSPS